MISMWQARDLRERAGMHPEETRLAGVGGSAARVVGARTDLARESPTTVVYPPVRDVKAGAQWTTSVRLHGATRIQGGLKRPWHLGETAKDGGNALTCGRNRPARPVAGYYAVRRSKMRLYSLDRRRPRVGPCPENSDQHSDEGDTNAKPAHLMGVVRHREPRLRQSP